MSKDRAQKKHAKEVARKKKLAEQKRKAERLARDREFPPLEVQANDAPPEFVEAVKKAYADIDFRDGSLFEPFEQEAFRVVASGGRATYVRDLGEYIRLKLNLGNQVYKRIPNLLDFIPYHDALLLTAKGHMVATFRSLKKAKGEGGTCYYSPYEPTVEVDGQKLVVAFSRHAIEQVCDRVSATWPSYGAAGDVFGVFYQCLDFEVCRLPRGGLAFTFFDECREGHWQRKLARQVLGEKYNRKEDYCYRVGYCPAVVEGRFLKAKTLLYPGFSDTPEAELVRRAWQPREEREEVLKLTGLMTAKWMAHADNFSVLGWFQDNGVEQVRVGKPWYAAL
jgi:hypothetical protein